MNASKSYRPAVVSTDLIDTTVGDLLLAASAETPFATAVVEIDAADGRHSYTYAELLDAATRTAHELQRRYEPGERIAIWSPSSLNWEVVQFAAALAGLVVVTINPAYKASELEYVLRQSGSSGLAMVSTYRGTDLREILDSVRPALPGLRYVHDLDNWNPDPSPDVQFRDVDPHSAAMIQYTSGTTGAPKGVLLSHRGMVNNALLFACRLGIGNGQTWLNPLPMFHLSGCGFGAMGSMWTRSTHVVFPFEARRALRLIESERAGFMPAVPTMLHDMLNHADFASTDVSSLKVVMSGATTVPPEVVRRVEDDFGAKFAVVFGQTEVSGVICQSFPDDSIEDKAEFVGKPLDHTEIRVVDDDGDVAECGISGEIQIRGFGVMIGYYDAPDQTTAALLPDGWLRTGDLGSMDERGYIRVTGRLKDMIIRGGENIYPREIEDRLYEHPDVADVAVLGIPDERWGEQVAAFVRLVERADTTAEQLSEFLKNDFTATKVPRIWVEIDELPLTPSGKIQKYVLRQQFLDGTHTLMP